MASAVAGRGVRQVPARVHVLRRPVSENRSSVEDGQGCRRFSARRAAVRSSARRKPRRGDVREPRPVPADGGPDERRDGRKSATRRGGSQAQRRVPSDEQREGRARGEVPESGRTGRGHSGRPDVERVRPRRARRAHLRARRVFRSTGPRPRREPIPPLARADDVCRLGRSRRRGLVLRLRHGGARVPRRRTFKPRRNKRRRDKRRTPFSAPSVVEVRNARLGPGRLVPVVPPRRGKRDARRARDAEVRGGRRGQRAAPSAGRLRAVHGLARVDPAIRDESNEGDAVGEGVDGRFVFGPRRRRHRVWARRAESGERDGDDFGDKRPGRHTRERGVVLVAAGGAEEGAAASRRRVAGEIWGGFAIRLLRKLHREISENRRRRTRRWPRALVRRERARVRHERASPGAGPLRRETDEPRGTARAGVRLGNGRLALRRWRRL